MPIENHGRLALQRKHGAPLLHHHYRFHVSARASLTRALSCTYTHRTYNIDENRARFH